MDVQVLSFKSLIIKNPSSRDSLLVQHYVNNCLIWERQHHFHMNSYLVYIAAFMGSFSRLSTKGDQLQVPIWNYYDQITLTQSKYHYRRVQDAFFRHFKCQFDKLVIRRVSDEAWNRVNQFGCIFLQFPTFTYLTVGYFKGAPYTF